MSPTTEKRVYRCPACGDVSFVDHCDAAACTWMMCRNGAKHHDPAKVCGLVADMSKTPPRGTRYVLNNARTAFLPAKWMQGQQ